MKAVLCIVVLVAVTMAQRSPYAPRPVGYPEVLNRFNTNTTGDLPTRIDGDNANQGPLQTPEGSIGDPYLLNRVNDWPRDKQPFWYLNREHIMDHRGQRNPNTQGTRPGQMQQPNRQGQGSQLGQGLAPRQGPGTGNQQGQWNRRQ